MNQIFFAQKAFILANNHTLLVQKSSEDPNQPDRWEVPGGRMEFGEDVDEHLKREVWEEVGLDVVPGRPFHVWRWQIRRPGNNGEESVAQIVAVARICHASSLRVSEANRQSDDYLASAQWVHLEDILTYNLIPNMVPVVQAFLEFVRDHRDNITSDRNDGVDQTHAAH